MTKSERGDNMSDKFTGLFVAISTVVHLTIAVMIATVERSENFGGFFQIFYAAIYVFVAIIFSSIVLNERTKMKTEETRRRISQLKEERKLNA